MKTGKKPAKPGKTKFSQNLSSQTPLRELAHGELIYSQGDVASSVFLIDKGIVKIAVTSDRKKKAVTSILCEGECFGEECLVERSHRRFTASSIEQTTIGSISKTEMLRRIQSESGFAELYVSHLLRRIARIEDDMVDQLVNNSEHRLARLLLKLGKMTKSSRHPSTIVNIDQTTLAQMVGTTRSRVSHFMNEFRKQGLIEYNGGLTINKSLLKFQAT